MFESRARLCHALIEETYMAKKMPTTAVVLIPPAEIWEPIQVIRRAHDRHIRRWMPHITLLYPFRGSEEFAELATQFSAVCKGIEPFRVELVEMRFFRHRRESFTLYLSPAPREALVRLQALVGNIVPDCDDVTRNRDGFTPHLSVGQVRGERQMVALKEELQMVWQPIGFTAYEISLIWRRDPPDDVFRIGQTVRLGAVERQESHQYWGNHQ
jgi:RNA 2',3'-cyclic 3'-phosphodiesterase